MPDETGEINQGVDKILADVAAREITSESKAARLAELEASDPTETLKGLEKSILDPNTAVKDYEVVPHIVNTILTSESGKQMILGSKFNLERSKQAMEAMKETIQRVAEKKGLNLEDSMKKAQEQWEKRGGSRIYGDWSPFREEEI